MTSSDTCSRKACQGAFNFWTHTSLQSNYAGVSEMFSLATCLWEIWVAPKAAHQLPLLYRILLGLSFFGLSFFLLYRLGRLTVAIVFALTTLISVLPDWLFDQ